MSPKWPLIVAFLLSAPAVYAAGKTGERLSCAVDAQAKSVPSSLQQLKLIEKNGEWTLRIQPAKGPTEIFQVLNSPPEIPGENRYEIVAAESSKNAKPSESVIVPQAVLLVVDPAARTARLAYRQTVYGLQCQTAGEKESPFQTGHCTASMQAAQAKTIEECQKLRRQVPQEELCYGDRAMAEIEAVIAACYDKVVTAEYGKRLLVVKLRDKKQYDNELRQQQDFVAMRDELCGLYKKCPGAWAASAYSNCQVQLNGFRFRMANAINRMNMALKSKSVDSKQWSRNALNFADSVCQLPQQLWNGEKVPEGCQSRLLGEIASFNGVPLPGSDPCGE